MAKKGNDRLVPLCGKCGHRHYRNFGKPCPTPTPVVERPPPPGFSLVKGFNDEQLRGGAANTLGSAPVVYRFPARRGGSLTEPPEAS